MILPGPALACKRCGRSDGDIQDGFHPECRWASEASEPEAEATGAPVLRPEALVGLAGAVVGTISPFTEATEAAILADHLCSFGVQIATGPHVAQGMTQQDTRMQFVIVGSSGTARKASSRIANSRLYGMLESPARTCEGVASAEALLEEFEDEVLTEDNPPKVLHGHADKRLLFYQSELAQTLIISSRNGSSLSPLLRDIWDKHRIEYRKVGGRHRTATNFTVSMMANITGEEYMALMHNRDISNGFANRMLYIWAERTKFIPFGPTAAEIEEALRPIVNELRILLSRARTVRAVTWSDEARDWWVENYPRLSTIEESGMVGHMTKRRDMHIIRLALLYCLQAGRSELRLEDFAAALAVWDYSEATVRLMVDRYYVPEEDRKGMAMARSDLMRGKGARLLNIVQSSPGCTRTEIRRSFNNNLKSGELDRMVMMMSDLIEVRDSTPERYWPRGEK